MNSATSCGGNPTDRETADIDNLPTDNRLSHSAATMTTTVPVGRGGSHRTSGPGDLDDMLLRVTVWANKTLRGDRSCSGDEADEGGGGVDEGGGGVDEGGGGGVDDDDEDFAAAYDRVYSATLHGDRTADQQLYVRLRECVAHHLNDVVAPALQRAVGSVELLAVARRAYVDYERATGRLADACMYLDAVMRRRGRGAEPVHAMVRTLLRDVLLRRCDGPVGSCPAGGGGRDDDAVENAARAAAPPDLMGRLEDAVVRSADVHLWSGQECADAAFCGRTVLAAVAGQDRAMARRLRDRYLDETDRRLRLFARSAAAAVDGYVVGARHAVDRETSVALLYGGPAVSHAVAARASQLLVAERRAFIAHSDTGLCRMLETGRDAETVAGVYALLDRLPDAAGPRVVADAVACCAGRVLHGRGAGSHVRGDGRDDDDGCVMPLYMCIDVSRFVGHVNWFHNTMVDYLRRSFAGHPVVARAIERHVRRALDHLDDVAYHVARHISDLLAGPVPPDVASLDRAFQLLRYLHDDELDQFDLYYRYQLMLRLTVYRDYWRSTTNADDDDDVGDDVDDREDAAYRMFVTRCGPRRSRRLRLLLDDARASRALAGRGRWPANLRLIAVNRHTWPSIGQPAVSFRFPPCAAHAFRRYRELYAAAHGGRRSVVFVPQMCTADVVAVRRGGRVRFTATMFQAAVLLLFNGRTRAASRAYVAAATEIPEPDLRNTLRSLVLDRVLCADGAGDTYWLHRDYADAVAVAAARGSRGHQWRGPRDAGRLRPIPDRVATAAAAAAGYRGAPGNPAVKSRCLRETQL